MYIYIQHHTTSNLFVNIYIYKGVKHSDLHVIHILTTDVQCHIDIDLLSPLRRSQGASQFLQRHRVARELPYGFDAANRGP
jgi:hypothetical protein